MTVIEHALSRTARLASDESASKFDSLKLILIFSGVGLLLSFACLSYGLDLSPGFF